MKLILSSAHLCQSSLEKLLPISEAVGGTVETKLNLNQPRRSGESLDVGTVFLMLTLHVAGIISPFFKVIITLTLENSGWDHPESIWNMDLGLLFAEPQQMDLRVRLKEDVEEEEDYGHMIPCKDEQDQEEKPPDLSDYNIIYSEPLQTTAEIEVKVEDEDEHLQEYDCLQERVSEHPHVMQQKIHGQNDELNLQLQERLHHCTVCRKSFTALKELEKHQKMHLVRVNEKQNSSNSHYEKIPTTTRSLKCHMRRRANMKNHKCGQCGKAFSYPSNLKTHMMLHTGEKPHKCIQCGKAFQNSSNLKAHMMLHTGEKPFKCTQCGKAFRTSRSVKRHMFTHTGEDSHICVQCGKTFACFEYLKHHMLTHGGEKCVQCGRAFKTSEDLECHMLTCTQCGNISPTSTELECKLCEKTTTTTSTHAGDEKDQMDLRLTLKEDVEEEDYGHMIPCKDEQDQEEKPFAELNCKTETDLSDYNIIYSEPLQTTAKIEVKVEDEDEHLQEYDCLQERVSEHPHVMQQKIHGQNDELNLQLQGRLHHCTVCRTSFTALKELKKHQKMHLVRVNEKQNSSKKQHKCSHCEKILKTATSLKCHMLIHANIRNHKCAQCGKAFSNTSNLKTHMMLHTGEKPHKCIQCGKAFQNSSNLKTHMMRHTGEKPFKCTQCGKAFRSSRSVKRHMFTHTGEDSHICVQCGKTFACFEYLKRHMLLHGGEKCVQCGRAFRTSEDLERHMLTHGGEKCVQCGRAFRTSEDLERHMLTCTQCGNISPTSTELECKLCEKTFRTSNYLQRHMLATHTCTQCGKVFPTSTEVKLHMLIHNRVNSHECRLCEKTTTTTSTEHKHHTLPHSDEKPHKCDRCGKGFVHISLLKSHMRIHTEEKSHLCAQCGKIFLKSSNLKNHMLTHTGEKPHECVQCGKSYSYIRSLKNHMRTHSGEKKDQGRSECVLCGKVVTNIKTHMFLHTGEKPHTCEQCGKAFAQASYLKTHMLVHTGEKPHKCDQCGKAFAQSANLSSHVLMMHTGKKQQLESSKCQTPNVYILNLPLGGATQ
ncbi:uncharacterized protein LOC143120223 isoform X2 [Alosa pseudoharengus]|uniref:uncharacterized protein LOC143120223 isoform X2 n=1 Tax=Alosa pseudoharengus TaxID=34774 RepID=UPI003F88AF9F